MPSEAGGGAFGATPSRTSWRTVPYHVVPLALAIVGLAVIAGGDSTGQRIALGSIALVALGRILGWWRRTVAFEDDRIVVEEGILERTQRVVPYDRIQQVDLHADVRARALGAASVRIEVAGAGGDRSVRLDVLSEAQARAVQADVLARRARRAPVAEDAAEREPEIGAGEPLLELSTGRLMLAGLMSDAVGVAAGAAGGLMGFAWQLGIVTPEDVAAEAHSRTIVIATVVALVVLTPLAAALAEVYRSGGYRLTLDGDDLHERRGLVETRRLTVPRRRVQFVTVRENVVGRRLGVVSLVVSSATRGGERQQAAVLRVPILPRRELEPFLEALMGDGRWAPPPLAPRPLAARRRAVVRRVVPLLALVGLAGWLTPWALAATPAALAIGVLWGLAAHRRAGHGATGFLAALGAGVVVHRLYLVPHARLQSARASASPLQRRARLATLHLDVAGRGAPHLLDVDGATAADLVRRLPLVR
jgi:putative membrane protein